MSDRELAGTVAVVTGGGSRAAGIGNGRAAAILLAQAGARTVVVDLSEDSLAETRDLIEERGGECLTVRADVSDPDDCAAVARAATGAWGRIDVLVNNVGLAGPPGDVVDVDLDAWDRCLRVNLTSMLLMSRVTIPHLRAAGGGSIVNVASVFGLRGGSPNIAYATTKAAIVGLTTSMATQHGAEGIRVNAVAPGFAHTPMVSSQGLSDDDRERRRLAAPLRTEGSGWDTGEAVLFLAGPRSRWITGVVLPVDGGLVSTIGMTSTMTVASAEGADR